MGIYFWDDPNKPIGLKADIQRHREEQLDLEKRIAEIESNPNPSQMELRSVKAYRHFLCKLLQSKADLLERLGRKQ